MINNSDSEVLTTGHNVLNNEQSMPIAKPKIKQVDVRNLSEKDAKSLHQQDPFMYYSIPGLRQATILLRDIDHSNVETLRHGYAVLQVNNAQQRPGTTETIIPRRSRISFECHPDVHVADLFGDLFGDDDVLDLEWNYV